MPKVLLIDDDPDLLDILGEWLSSRGHVIRAISDPSTAHPVMVEFRPDLVVLDGLFRGTTGQAIASDLESDGQMRIIYLSGLPRNELPADRIVLQKPIDLDVLDRIIRSVARSP